MPISKGILGLNARNFLYLRKYNRGTPKSKADHKLATKKLLLKHNIPTAKLIKHFNNRKDLRLFDNDLPAEGFVIKPARGYGGEGILVFKSWHNGIGETVSGQQYTVRELEVHLLDIFDGVYSLQQLPDTPYIEERVITHPFFKRISQTGLPDIRIIVFNKVPVMAMLRLPTKASKGKANLHLGALGTGIDLRTGITTYGVLGSQPIIFIPDTKIKVAGIKIPYWDEILKIAAETQVASGLGYAGVDIVLDQKTGPLVLEVNARPGLSIQIANRASLRPRLERVEHLEIATIERGIELSRNLFAEAFSEKVTIEPKTLSVFEPISVIAEDKTYTYHAKLDSGAYRTSIDQSLVDTLQLKAVDRKILVKAASGIQERKAVKFEFYLSGRKISTVATVAKRTHLRYPIIIGRRDLKGFLINPSSNLEDEELEDAGHHDV